MDKHTNFSISGSAESAPKPDKDWTKRLMMEFFNFTNWHILTDSQLDDFLEHSEVWNGRQTTWISVKDRLPEIKGNYCPSDAVLVCESDGDMYVACVTYYPIEGFRKKEEYRWSEQSTGCGCCARDLRVEYWMPLPKLPKE